MISNKRKICVVTGSRADYGLLRKLMMLIKQDDDLVLQVVVTGMHLSHHYGYSVDRIKADGFDVSNQIELLFSSNTKVAAVKSVGVGMLSFAENFERLQPDIVLILGDRYEIFAAGSAANMMNIPLAHIHGGELTYGAVDDSLRHAITKLAHIHFAVTTIYKKRIIQMGEQPDNVYNFGAPGLDVLDDLVYLSRAELASKLGLAFGKFNMLITYHSETRGETDNAKRIATLLHSLEQFDATFIFTAANCDPGGQIINTRIKEFVKAHPKTAFFFSELGIDNYLNLVNQVDLVVGNSSSGVIEVPCVGTPTINIGARQLGRIRAASVIDVDCNQDEIVTAINKVISQSFHHQCSMIDIPYRKMKSSFHIKETLKRKKLEGICKKPFFDLAVQYDYEQSEV